MTALMIALVLGWGFALDRMIRAARQEIGLAKAPTGGLVMFCWIPIVSVAGIFAPQIFVGRDTAQRLRKSDTSGRWLNYIRLASLGYLVLLIGIPVAFAFAEIAAGRR
jgi:hypothetical protein